jgi:hypothetical protein
MTTTTRQSVLFPWRAARLAASWRRVVCGAWGGRFNFDARTRACFRGPAVMMASEIDRFSWRSSSKFRPKTPIRRVQRIQMVTIVCVTVEAG